MSVLARTLRITLDDPSNVLQNFAAPRFTVHGGRDTLMSRKVGISLRRTCNARDLKLMLNLSWNVGITSAKFQPISLNRSGEISTQRFQQIDGPPCTTDGLRFLGLRFLGFQSAFFNLPMNFEFGHLRAPEDASGKARFLGTVLRN